MSRLGDWSKKLLGRDKQEEAPPVMKKPLELTRALASPLSAFASTLSRQQKLVQELFVDPLSRGYTGQTDAEAAVDLNTIYREKNKTAMLATEIAQAIDPTEWGALTDAEQGRIFDVLHMGTINPFGIEATIFTNVFGPSTTITALQALRKEDISRATELGLGVVRPGHVGKARA